jgi:cobalt-zinc-cadmium efflux system protein
LNSLGLLAITALLGWQALERFREPQAVVGFVPVVAGLTAAVANWGVARILRGPAAEDASIRLAYVHNRGDTLVSLGPVLAGALVLTTGYTVADSVVALVIAIAIVVPSVRVVGGGYTELAWPESIACGHAEAEMKHGSVPAS